MGAGNEDGETRQTCPRKREVLSEGQRDKGWRRETRGTQKEEGRGKNNGEQEREAWRSRTGGRRRGGLEEEVEMATGRERTWPGQKELQLAGPGGGASSPSLMAVK